MKRATGPSGLRLSNDWASVVIDAKYGEWHVALEPVNSRRVHVYRTADLAMTAAMGMLAKEAS